MAPVDYRLVRCPCGQTLSADRIRETRGMRGPILCDDCRTEKVVGACLTALDLSPAACHRLARKYSWVHHMVQRRRRPTD